MRFSGRLWILFGGLIAANCLVWGGCLLACGACAVSSSSEGGGAGPTAVAQATLVPWTRAPRLSPSPMPTATPRPTRTPAPTFWIANPTVPWSTVAAPTAAATVAPARPTYTPTPWPTQVIQGANAEAKAQALMALAAQGSDIPFRVTFTEAEVEREIARYLAENPETPARNVRISFQPGHAVITGQVKVGGLWISPTVYATAVARNGKAVVTITRIDLGPFPLPGGVEEQLNQQLAAILAGLDTQPFRFTAITLSTGRITVEGRTK
ncbi:MAG: hypothetical protein KKA73_19770 [Chloroflexi bacterium]|nr:hypothetical protein [Chloroflexota bacterium]MBU1749927.1 hypothetical protein [Chloroflexota bacterium]MBU1879470.1 hypothetical protein [Chloroflexota bacterium]